MSNKINRVGLSKLCMSAEETQTAATSALTGGANLNWWDWMTRVSNLTVPYKEGQCALAFSATGTLTASTSHGIAQQCGISVPDANAYTAEINGMIEGSVPAGVVVVPFIGVLAVGDTFATALTDNKVVKRGRNLDSGVAPSGYFSREYSRQVVINQSPLFNFLHGFRFINTTASDVTIDLKMAKFSFRGLDNTLNYFDPVR